MVLPAHISARQPSQPHHQTLPDLANYQIPLRQPISQNDEQIPSLYQAYPTHFGGNLPYSPQQYHPTPAVHSFNELLSIYYNLSSDQVPNKSNPRTVLDPLSDIQRREREIEKERDYREHELRMEYEKRLEEFEADFKLKEQELEKEKLHQEKRMIADREREIEDDRKQMLKAAFGTEDLSLGEEDFVSEDDGNYEDSFVDDEDESDFDEPEGSDWEIDRLLPHKSQRHRESRYTYPSERHYKPQKGRKPYRNTSDEENGSSDDEEEDHHHHGHHHHKSKHHHKKSKKEKGHHHKHHHNEIDADFLQSNQMVMLDWEEVNSGAITGVQAEV